MVQRTIIRRNSPGGGALAAPGCSAAQPADGLISQIMLTERKYPCSHGKCWPGDGGDGWTDLRHFWMLRFPEIRDFLAPLEKSRLWSHEDWAFLHSAYRDSRLSRSL